MFRDQTRYGRDPDVVVRSAPATFNQPLTKWHRHARVFTCSWSDFFIKEADPWRAEAWDIIRRTPHLTYQILTKRVGRLLAEPQVCLPPDWGSGWSNVHLGVSIESNAQAFRAEYLRRVPAAIRFISAEPLLGPLDQMSLAGISWVISGGESGGPPERALVLPASYFESVPAEQQTGTNYVLKREALTWVRDIRDRCQRQGVAYFHKQWGGPRPESAGRLLDGRTWDQFPTEIAPADWPRCESCTQPLTPTEGKVCADCEKAVALMARTA